LRGSDDKQHSEQFHPKSARVSVRGMVDFEHEHASRWSAIVSIASNIGCAPPFEDRQLVRWDEDGDASGDAGLSWDEAVAFEGKDHLMDRRWTDAEVALHVGSGRRLVEHVGIDIDEGQILASFLSEAM
jgi:hypothetical protein